MIGYIITAPHFVAGVEVCDRGWIRRTAPIIKWCKGSKISMFQKYCAQKGYHIEQMPKVTNESE